ncbi:MAG TPA: DMT family transporter [Dongiaceae bacterium]|jgi:RarD protein|nr:DMT family transporter [Dongiaceae bacterium]
MTTTTSLASSAVNTNLKGILLYCLAVFLLGIMDASAKWLSASYPVGEMLFFRGAFGFLPVLLIYLLQKRQEANPKILPVNLRGQLLRGFYVTMITLTFFIALTGMRLAEVTAVAMTGPILMVVLGALLLGEKAGKLRWICVLISFFGVLVIVQPTSGKFSFYGLAAFASAIFYALAAAQTRVLTRTDSFLQIILCTTIMIFVIGLGLAAFEHWVMPHTGDWLVLLLLGFTGGISNIFYISAFRNAEISLLAPFDYSVFLWAVLFGTALFGEVPSLTVILGAGMIAATGTVLAQKTAS